MGTKSLQMQHYISFYIENEADVPADGGNYWHYASDGVTPEIWNK